MIVNKNRCAASPQSLCQPLAGAWCSAVPSLEAVEALEALLPLTSPSSTHPHPPPSTHDRRSLSRARYVGRNTKRNGLNYLVEGSRNGQSDNEDPKGVVNFGSGTVGSLANINVNTQARYVIEGLCESDDDSCGDLKMEWQFKPSCCVDDHGLIDRCTTFKAEPFDEDYFNGLDLDNHKACTDYTKYGTDEEDQYCVAKPLTKKDFKRTEASGKAAYDDYKRMRGADDTGVICTDFTLDPDPIKACTWQQAALDAFVSDQAERTQIVDAEAEVSLIAASDSFDPSNGEVKPDGCAVKLRFKHRVCFIQQNSPIEFGQLYEKKIRKLQQAPRRHPSHPPTLSPSAAPVRRCRLSRYTIPPRDATRARHSAR